MSGSADAEKLRKIITELFQAHVADQLESNLQARRWLEFDLLLRIVRRHPSSAYTSALYEALHLQSNQFNNDDIVNALSEICDPRSVVELRYCAWWRPYWEVDEHLARKCLYALGQIGDQAALDTIVEVAVSGPRDLRDRYALPELARLNYPPERQLRAHYDATSVTVYQAYRPEIARAEQIEPTRVNSTMSRDRCLEGW